MTEWSPRVYNIGQRLAQSVLHHRQVCQPHPLFLVLPLAPPSWRSEGHPASHSSPRRQAAMEDGRRRRSDALKSTRNPTLVKVMSYRRANMNSNSIQR